MEIKLVQTEDTSHTLFSDKYGEHYHSIHGSINESMHIFIQAGFKQINKKEIKILEIGFGTGLNTLLTLIEQKRLKQKVHYTCIEKYPLPKKIYTKLNYSDLLHCPQSDFIKLHESPWNRSIEICTDFILHKILCDINNMDYNDFYDLVYFDAFSPDIQPELWTEKIFSEIYKSMNSGGILTTYSAKGEVKRKLKKTGFTVEHIPGPKGKRVITRALKNC